MGEFYIGLVLLRLWGMHKSRRGADLLDNWEVYKREVHLLRRAIANLKRDGVDASRLEEELAFVEKKMRPMTTVEAAEARYTRFHERIARIDSETRKLLRDSEETTRIYREVMGLDQGESKTPRLKVIKGERD